MLCCFCLCRFSGLGIRIQCKACNNNEPSHVVIKEWENMSRLTFLHASIKPRTERSEHKAGSERRKKKFCNCTWSASHRARMTKICSEKSDFYGRCTKHIGNLWFARAHKLTACGPESPRKKRAQKTHLHRASQKRACNKTPAIAQCSHELNSNQLNLAFHFSRGASTQKQKAQNRSSHHRNDECTEMQQWFFSSLVWLTVNPPVPSRNNKRRQGEWTAPKNKASGHRDYISYEKWV